MPNCRSPFGLKAIHLAFTTQHKSANRQFCRFEILDCAVRDRTVQLVIVGCLVCPHVNPLVVHGRGWNLLFVRLLLSTGAGTCRGSRADSSQALEDISNTSSQNVDGSAYSPVFGVDGHAKRYRLFHVVQFRPDGHERIAQFVE